MPRWQGSNRKSRLPPNWAALRLEVLRRDFHRCQHVREDTGCKCLARATDVDHIHAGSDDNRMEALQALCTYHHRIKSGREGGLASGRARRARKDADKPQHPGIMSDPHEFDPPPF